VERTREHLLEEILLIAIAAILSGAKGWNEIEDYARCKREWLSGFLKLPGGIPSHDTFNRVFSALDPEELEKGFAAWVSSIAKLTAGEVVAIDGKALRGTSVPGKKAIVHMVSAWANTNGLVLAQRRVDEKSNEITAIPKLLDALELSGTVVTLAAMGCQRAIAEKIAAKKADYILAVERESGPAAGGDPRLVSEAGQRCGCGRNRLRPRAGRATDWLGDCRSVAGREGRGMGVSTGLGTHRSETLSQAHGPNRAPDPLLHHQPQARRGAAEPLHPTALGHRKQTALGPRCQFRRRP
jgi:hypothetical protein